MKRKHIVFILLATVLALLNLPLPASVGIRASVRDNAAPFQTLLLVAVRHGRAGLHAILDSRSAILETDDLREALANAHFQLARLDDLEADNRELRQRLDFSRRQTYRLVICQVVSRGGMGGWWQTVRLDKGRNHGIGEAMAVITMDGLVGRTGGGRFRRDGPGLVVTDKTSDVLLITDPGCKVACEVGSGRFFGIASGTGPALRGPPELDMLSAAAPFDMDYIPGNAVVNAGDRVITSGRGGVIPPGIPVGTVRAVGMDASGLYQRATVTPAADLQRLNTVFVVVPDKRPGMLAHESDENLRGAP